ncbi:MAG: phage Gp37/Gp68 family protein [Azoarcus sp.]|jgi:protein gp37|nr:phage Gp37/Gp68 family protein [Azoarcus sp.]
MGDKTGIEWCDATWNPVTGCTKISDGCKFCYAERDWKRLSANSTTRYYRRTFSDVRCHEDLLDQPLLWQRPRWIFVNSMSDLFHEAVPIDFIERVFEVMARAPQHTFITLTKRPERMNRLVGSIVPALENVWLGVSVEDQDTADRRIPPLIDTLAGCHFVSFEPLLGYIDISYEHRRALDWVIVGGESGPKARPMNPEWVRSIRDQCAQTELQIEIPFLFKQWGEWFPRSQWEGNPALVLPDDECVSWPDSAKLRNTAAETWHRVGKKAAGRVLDGLIHDEYPIIGRR